MCKYIIISKNVSVLLKSIRGIKREREKHYYDLKMCKIFGITKSELFPIIILSIVLNQIIEWKVLNKNVK